MAAIFHLSVYEYNPGGGDRRYRREPVSIFCSGQEDQNRIRKGLRADWKYFAFSIRGGAGCRATCRSHAKRVHRAVGARAMDDRDECQPGGCGRRVCAVDVHGELRAHPDHKVRHFSWLRLALAPAGLPRKLSQSGTTFKSCCVTPLRQSMEMMTD